MDRKLIGDYTKVLSPIALVLIISVVTVTILGMLQPQTASATGISPDTTVDDNTINGNCTLREAIIAANTDTAVDNCPAGSGTDTITLAAGVYTLAIAGIGEDAAATGDLDITKKSFRNKPAFQVGLV